MPFAAAARAFQGSSLVSHNKADRAQGSCAGRLRPTLWSIASLHGHLRTCGLDSLPHVAEALDISFAERVQEISANCYQVGGGRLPQTSPTSLSDDSFSGARICRASPSFDEAFALKIDRQAGHPSLAEVDALLCSDTSNSRCWPPRRADLDASLVRCARVRRFFGGRRAWSAHPDEPDRERLMCSSEGVWTAYRGVSKLTVPRAACLDRASLCTYGPSVDGGGLRVADAACQRGEQLQRDARGSTQEVVELVHVEDGDSQGSHRRDGG